MQIAFYKARHGTLLDRLIDACTGRVGYSHVELVFSDGTWFSSSARDGGVRFKRIDPDPAHWTIFPARITGAHEHAVRCWATTQLGRKYDYPGVLGFVLPALRLSRRRWFCSEICAAALSRSVLEHARTPTRARISPNALFLIHQYAAQMSC